MPRLRKERPGTELRIYDLAVRFSQWPTAPNQQLQAELLTSNPWEIIRSAIAKANHPGNVASAAQSFLRQSQDFYRAAQNASIASKPLLLYYCLLNLAKAFILHRAIVFDLDRAGHGIAEDRLVAGAREFHDATVTVYPTQSHKPHVFDLFGQALRRQAIVAPVTYTVVTDLLPQIVIGHRLWASATGGPERFVRVQWIRLRDSRKSNSIWLTIDFDRSDLTYAHLTHSQFKTNCGLAANFVEVRLKDKRRFAKSCRFELDAPVPYNRRPSDVIAQTTELLNPKLWTVVRSIPPYRRHYVYAAPPNSIVLHPILSIYAIIFYLGSVTRYRPHHFDLIGNSAYGNQIYEIIENQMRQVLFQMASEFAEREVSSPAIL